MNWYKKNNYTYDYYYYKYSFNWGKFLLPIMIPLIPMLVYLGISPQEANKIAEKNNNNPTAIKQQLQSMISEKEIPPMQRNLPYSDEKVIDQKTGGEKLDISQDYMQIANYIAPHEGRKAKVYDDGKGFPTIGIGHLINEKKDIELFKKLFGFSEKESHDIFRGKRVLSNEQIDKLFAYDLPEHVNKTKRLVPKFDNYPPYIQAALADATFRGDLYKKTIALINSGNWADAAKEYLNNNEYRTTKLRGVVTRMNENQKAMLQYAKELGQI